MNNQEENSKSLFLTVDETAEILNINRRKVQELCRQKKLPAVKFGKHWRIHKEKLELFIRKKTNYII